MPGSVRLIRDRDVWELRVYLGRDESGRVRHRHATFRGTKKEAERAVARMVAEVDAKHLGPAGTSEARWGDGTTINDAIAGWKANGWDDLSPSTTRRYESIWTTHVRDSIGKKKIARLSPYDVERYFRALKAQGLAEATVRQTRALLHRACRLAKKWSGGALPNPVADTELPSWSISERIEVRSPTQSEVRALLQAAAGDPRFSAFLRLVAATGMRRGEACAVRWDDLDFAAATVRVDESVVTSRGGAVVKPPKTRASVRKIALDPGTVAALEALRSAQETLAAACRLTLASDGFLFSAEPGGVTPPHPDVMSHMLAKTRDSAKLPADIHLHSLRHFNATVLDPVISEAQKQARLGWSTVHMARHYTDAVDAEDRRAAKHVGRLLG